MDNTIGLQVRLKAASLANTFGHAGAGGMGFADPAFGFSLGTP